jgi:hypothetical protein
MSPKSPTSNIHTPINTAAIDPLPMSTPRCHERSTTRFVGSLPSHGPRHHPTTGHRSSMRLGLQGCKPPPASRAPRRNKDMFGWCLNFPYQFIGSLYYFGLYLVGCQWNLANFSHIAFTNLQYFG